MKRSKRILAGFLAALQVVTCLNLNMAHVSAWGTLAGDTEPLKDDEDGSMIWKKGALKYDPVNHPDQIPFVVVYQYVNGNRFIVGPWYETLWLNPSGSFTGRWENGDDIYQNTGYGHNVPDEGAPKNMPNFYGDYEAYSAGSGDIEYTFTAPKGYYFCNSYNFGRDAGTGVMYKFVRGTKVHSTYSDTDSADYYTSLTYKFKAGKACRNSGAIDNIISGFCLEFRQIPRTIIYNVYNGDLENKVTAADYYLNPEELDASMERFFSNHKEEFAKLGDIPNGFTCLCSDQFNDKYYEGKAATDENITPSYAEEYKYGGGYVSHLNNYFFDFDKYELEHHIKYQVVDVNGDPVPGTSLFGEKTNNKGFIATEDNIKYERDTSQYGRFVFDEKNGLNRYTFLDDTTNRDSGVYYLNGENIGYGKNRVTHKLAEEESSLYPNVSENIQLNFDVVNTNTNSVAPYAVYKGSISNKEHSESYTSDFKIVSVDDTHSVVQIVSTLKGTPVNDADADENVKENTETKENEDGSKETTTTREYGDGSKETEVTKEYPDGSKDLSYEKENKNGTKEGSEVSIDANGKVTDITTHEKTSTGETTIPYEVDSGSNVTAKKITTTEKEFSIPKSIKPADGNTYQVTAIADDAMKSNKTVAKLSMGDNIKKVGKRAFQKCSNLKNVTFSKKVKTLSDSAFSDCGKLSSVSLPASTQSIGKACFKNCKKLKKLTLGKAKKGGFLNMDGDTAWGAAVKISIGASALENCVNLKEVVINSQVREIGYGAFRQCKKLAKIIVYSLILKVVGKDALKGVHDCTIKVPKKKIKPYHVLFKNKGQGKKVIVAKL